MSTTTVPATGQEASSTSSKQEEHAHSIPQASRELFEEIRAKFPANGEGLGRWVVDGDGQEGEFIAETDESVIRERRWEILTISALSAAGHNDVAADLYTYLITTSPQYATPSQRQALVRRLREAMVKLVSVVGVPKPLETVFQIAERERVEDRDLSFSREKWSSGPDNVARGKAWLDKIYRHNYASITTDYMAAHRDFRYISEEITYGFYLSDHHVLDGVDTELVVLAGIMLQNLPRETGWHLRGTRRIGVGKTEVAAIWECIVRIAGWCHVAVDRLPRVDDIEHEVN